MCAKCHSACENGRSHQGLVPANDRDCASLPLDSEGRTTCTTCHDSRNHDAHEGSGSHLRISNLRRELCLACHRRDGSDVPRIEIISPLERAVVQEERLAFIGRASRITGPDLTVRLNGAEFHLHVRGGEFSTWLKLQEGVNRVEVAQDERLLWKGEVFMGRSAAGGYGFSSSGHRTGNRDQCLECHLKKDELRSGVTSSAPALCYGCHDRNDEKRYVHGPLAVGDCLACHDPHGGYGSAHLRKEQTLLCWNCHAARESLATTACNASGKGCVDCHDPHQSDARYLLKGPQTTMRDNYLAQR
jgi:predicted CXXCH cytochrome family protein